MALWIRLADPQYAVDTLPIPAQRKCRQGHVPFPFSLNPVSWPDRDVIGKMAKHHVPPRRTSENPISPTKARLPSTSKWFSSHLLLLIVRRQNADHFSATRLQDVPGDNIPGEDPVINTHRHITAASMLRLTHPPPPSLLPPLLLVRPILGAGRIKHEIAYHEGRENHV
jgi:hypothetical protein